MTTSPTICGRCSAVLLLQCAAIVFICTTFQSTTRAENWPQLRGPAFNGSTTEASLPNTLDPAKNVVWKTELPGHGSSTPCVWNDRVFVSALDKETKKLLAMCYDSKTGKLLWKHETGEGFISTNRINLSGPTPLTDGKTVWFYYGSGDLAAFDLDGKALWSRNIEKDHGAFNFQWIYCSSPTLYNGKLYVQVLHRDIPVGRNGRGSGSTSAPANSYLLAMDPATGKDIFKHVRPNDARMESRESYATPLPHEGNGRKELILIGGDCITGHDPDTGKELWRLGGWNPQGSTVFRVVATPVLIDNKVVLCTPQQQGKVIAVNLGGSGDITATHKAWENTEVKSDVPAPLVYQGNLMILDGDFRKGISSLEPASGKQKWFTPLPSRALFRASPIASDGKIYVMNEDAQVWVLSATDGKILSTTQLETEGTARGCIVPAQGRLFARTGSYLYCFGSTTSTPQ